uniref:Uncharacterized protein n=1 Tax=Cacopsylla melanoneura TaxID=428564 RepID=A0A8D8TSR5_9HEMI
MMKSLYSKNCNPTPYNCPCPPKPPLSGFPKQGVSPCPQRCPNTGTNKSPLELCKEKKKYQQKCGRPPDDCYDIKLAMPPVSGASKFTRLICPTSAGDTGSQMFHLCDNEVISLANTCGEITLSRQCLDTVEEDYENMKRAQKADKNKKKENKKRGKERFKQCKKSAKQIYKKYKDREKLRAANEKDYYKKCLKQEKEKVKAAKKKYKEKKKIAKQKMKQNKKKNKERLKKLKQRLKQRCQEMKSRDPHDPKTDTDSCDSMEFDDPMDLVNNDPPCDGELTCISLTKMMMGNCNNKPIYGCRAPDQICVPPPHHNKQSTSCPAKKPACTPACTPCR